MRVWFAIAAAGLGLSAGAAGAAPAACTGNPDALGTARVIAIDPAAHPRIGTLQYATTLPLAENEVVLTFDDGPLPPYTAEILKALAAECVRATFFIVGRQARLNPETVRRISAAGHTVATHSENHPFAFSHLPRNRMEQEIERGVASTASALGDARRVAPFFRIPGLRRSRTIESYLAARGLALWSTDVLADDWRGISAREIVKRALRRLADKGSGVLLLHDIQPATVLALPALLRALKAGGYRIVHVTAAGAADGEAAPDPDPEQAEAQGWPRLVAGAPRPATAAGGATPAPGSSSASAALAAP